MGAYVAVIAAAAARQEREFLDQFRQVGATSPDAAIPMPERSAWTKASRTERWVRRGVLRPAPGGYWLDESAYQTHEREQAKGAAVVLGVLLLVVLVLGLVVWMAQPDGPSAQ